MSLLLEEAANGANGIGLGTYILMAVLVLAILVFPLFTNSRKNKTEMEKYQKMLDSFKKGDNIVTGGGIFGKIVSFEEKEGVKLLTIETGNEKNKSFLTIDAGAVYANLSADQRDAAEREKQIKLAEEQRLKQAQEKLEAKQNKKEKVQQETPEEVQQEAKQEVVQEQKVEKPKNSTKNTQAKSASKKTQTKKVQAQKVDGKKTTK